MKSRVSNDALHSGFDEANVKFVPLSVLKRPVPIPRPSSTFFLALFFPEGSATSDQSGLRASQLSKKIVERDKKANIFSVLNIDYVISGDAKSGIFKLINVETGMIVNSVNLSSYGPRKDNFAPFTSFIILGLVTDIPFEKRVEFNQVSEPKSEESQNSMSLNNISNLKSTPLSQLRHKKNIEELKINSNNDEEVASIIGSESGSESGSELDFDLNDFECSL